METCNKSHVQIAYNSKNCPLCKLLEKFNTTLCDIVELEIDIAVLNQEIKDLNQEIKDLKQKE